MQRDENGMLSKHPETGEAGEWSFNPQTGWTDRSSWGGPRTHYADGGAVQGDMSHRQGWNPEWQTRLNDIYRLAGGQQGASSDTTLKPGENYQQLQGDYWRTDAGRQFVNDAAVSGRSIADIYNEMRELNAGGAPASGPPVYDPNANVPQADPGMMTRTGWTNTTPGLTKRRLDALDTSASNAAIRATLTGNHSWAKGNMTDTHPDDRAAIEAMYNDPNWNPFYDRYYTFGGTTKTQGNVADYLYSITKDPSQAGNRDKVMRKYKQFLIDSGTGEGNMKNRATALDMMNTTMNKQIFDAMGLGELGYEYSGNAGSGTGGPPVYDPNANVPQADGTYAPIPGAGVQGYNPQYGEGLSWSDPQWVYGPGQNGMMGVRDMFPEYLK